MATNPNLNLTPRDRELLARLTPFQAALSAWLEGRRESAPALTSAYEVVQAYDSLPTSFTAAWAPALHHVRQAARAHGWTPDVEAQAAVVVLCAQLGRAQAELQRTLERMPPPRPFTFYDEAGPWTEDHANALDELLAHRDRHQKPKP